MTNPDLPTIHWTTADGQTQQCGWLSATGARAPAKVQPADDSMNADLAYKLACEGTALLWQGDYHQARQMLAALTRRIDQKTRRKTKAPAPDAASAFHQHRQAQAHKARILAMLIVPLNQDFSIPLRRAPDLRQACAEAYPPQAQPVATTLRELLGLVGAHEWRKKGVPVAALGQPIHPWHGVFSPVRGEYVDLVAKAPLPTTELAFEIGVGSGVLSAVLASRGVKKIIATDLDQRALDCASENLQRLGYAKQVVLQKTDLFPEGQAALIVCNPPWLPVRPNSAVEHAIYDPDSRMLKGFLQGLPAHLSQSGEAWLIMSDLAEHLGLRGQHDLWNWIEAAGLMVAGKLDIRPRHGKASDQDDPLHAARSQEITSLWRLRHKAGTA